MLAPILCLCFTLADAVEPKSADLVTRSYPLAAVAVNEQPSPPALRVTPIRSTWGEDGADVGEDADGLSADSIVDLLANTIAPDQWEYAGRSLEIHGPDRGQVLQVTAPLEVHGEVRRYLDYLRAVTSQRIRLRADVYRVVGPGEGQIPTGILGRGDGDRVGALQREGTLRLAESFQLSLESGVPAMRHSIETVPFLRDLHVEIAQAAACHDPSNDVYEIGTALRVRADRDSRGRALVTFAVRHSWQDGPPEEILIEARHRVVSERGAESLPGGGTVQSPRVSFATIAGSARLEAGSTAILSASAPSGLVDAPGVLLALTLEEIPPAVAPFQSGERQLVLYDVRGDFSAGVSVERFGQRALEIDIYGDDDDRVPPYLAISAFGSAERDAMQQAVASTMNQDLGEDVHIDVIANQLVVAGPAAVVEHVVRMFRDQDSEHPVFGAVTITQGTAPTKNERLLLGLSAAVGDAFAVCGTQETYVLDYDIDVANNMSTFKPQVRDAIDGIAAHVRVSPFFTGQVSIDARVIAHLRRDGKSPYNARTNDFGVLHQPTFLSSVMEGRVTLAPGGATAIGSIQLPGGGTDPVVLGAVKSP